MPPQLHDEDTPPDWLRRGYLDPTPGARKVVLIRDQSGKFVCAEITLAAGPEISPDDLAQLQWFYDESHLPVKLRAVSSDIGDFIVPRQPPPAETFRIQLYPPRLDACEIIGDGIKHPTATLEERRIAYPLGAGSGALRSLTIQVAPRVEERRSRAHP